MNKNLEMYKISKNNFNQLIRVDLEDESIMYYNTNNGNWSDNLSQAGWSFQNKKVQKDYESFLHEISADDQLLEFIVGLEIDEQITTLQDHKVIRID